MRKLLPLLLLCFSIQAAAQVSYQHYLDSSVRWSYEFSYGGPGAYYYNFTEYTFHGDTLIDTTWYWNVWARVHSTFNGVPGYSYKPIFGMRETPDKKFYQYAYDAQKEVLMNDFNLKIGDTLQNNVNGVFRVDVIDTVMFGNEKRPLYRSIYPCGVIEGIGFIARDGSFNSQMRCFQKQQDYYPGSGAQCGFSGLDDSEVWTVIRSWPNPTHSILNLELPPAFQKPALNYRWYNAAGQLRGEGTLNGTETEPTLSTEDLIPGIYFLQISSAERWTQLRVGRGGFRAIALLSEKN